MDRILERGLGNLRIARDTSGVRRNCFPENFKSHGNHFNGSLNQSPEPCENNSDLITQDPDDNKFVDCAICGMAEYIVSNDRHFDILKSIDFPLVTVRSIQEFSKELADEM